MIDATLSSFERDVIEASMEVPVLVNFWAPWCAPCKTLGPLMEKLEREYGGRFKLVNVNSDTNPELASSFALKSLPYAVAFVDGNAVAQFSGVQPEAFLRAFLDRLIPNPADLEHRSAREALAGGEPEVAEDSLRNALAMDPAHDGARLDMIALLLDRDDHEGAERHFQLLSQRATHHMNYSHVAARVQSIVAAKAVAPRDALEARIDRDGNDLQARLDLASVLTARRDFRGAMEQLLEIVARDRTFGNDIGRLRMIDVLVMAHADDDLVSDYRGRLSQLLF